MTQASLTHDIIAAFAGEMTPKFLATLNAERVPNVVPIISLEAVDEKTLIFGEFMMWKTRRNLEVNPCVAAAVITTELKGWVVKGEFVEFQRTGPYFDRIMGRGLFRYNAYTGVRSAGVIRVREVTDAFRLSQFEVLVGLLRSRLGAAQAKQHPGDAVMPAPVREKFSRLKALKMLAYCDSDGYPTIFPVLSLLPAGERNLVFAIPSRSVPPLGAEVAVCVITFDPVAYQIKGKFCGIERGVGGPVGVIAVSEVYSACPPLPGERLA